jgi:hypothetical protein
MAISKVSVANIALQKLSSGKISALDQDHPNARTMDRAYDPCRKKELRRYDWGFAIKRASLPADSEGPVWGNYNRFALPNDYLRILFDDESGQAVRWKIEAARCHPGQRAPECPVRRRHRRPELLRQSVRRGACMFSGRAVLQGGHRQRIRQGISAARL